MYMRIQMFTDKQSFSDTALVVENIVENLDVKRAFWAEILSWMDGRNFTHHRCGTPTQQPRHFCGMNPSPARISCARGGMYHERKTASAAAPQHAVCHCAGLCGDRHLLGGEYAGPGWSLGLQARASGLLCPAGWQDCRDQL